MIILTGNDLTLDQVVRASDRMENVAIAKGALERVKSSREKVEGLIDSGKPIYGVTTGFGDLISERVSLDKIKDLQTNLIRSHSSGYGKPLDERTVRAMMLVRANSLSKGYSGVRPELIQSLLAMLNANVIPYIPEKGSVGSSGDLSPLAHLALVLIGEGRVVETSKIVETKSVLSMKGLKPINLEAKEGISLINGTSFMLANLSLGYKDSENLFRHAIIAAGMSMHLLSGTERALECGLFDARPYVEHSIVARALKLFVQGSERIRKGTEAKVQDAYSLRCIPTVLGSVLQTMNYVKGIVNTELNSATDNPLVLNEITSGCNFHGEPLALAADYLSIALTELGNISERRVFRILDKSLSGLSPFLADKPGVESGLMIPQYVAAALCNDNKVLSYPSSADNIPTSANQEDHNSMGGTSTRKLREIVKNVKGIIAIEMLVAYRGMEVYGVSGRHLSTAFSILNETLGDFRGDKETTTKIEKISELIDSNKMLEEIPIRL
ncbi:MAG: histidine ammonia-lyase [Thermoplasmatales archaeon]|jgi:histidine ammonia-lyase|nr:histidine ammonia-lyase [Candidatus Thermoplasmatota archaeon]MDA8056062.1 histidine ammonia-lyase [Thermoplasmatales archaeon]